MTDEVRVVGARTNIDALDERVFDDLLLAMVDELATEGGDFLKAIVPKGETLRLTEHSGHEPASRDLSGIHAIVGVTRIPEATGSSIFSGGKDSAEYPSFVDQGTGIFGDAGMPIFAHHFSLGGSERGAEFGFMKLPPDGEHNIFQYEVAGQEGKHFMAATLAYLRMALEMKMREYRSKVTAELEALKASAGEMEEAS
jgi:hypothetical protein